MLRRLLRLLILAGLAVSLSGAACWRSSAPPPPPPPSLNAENAVNCPIRCTNWLSGETLVNEEAKLCVPAEVNSNLPNGPQPYNPEALAVFAFAPGGWCARTVVSTLTRTLNDQAGHCGWNCEPIPETQSRFWGQMYRDNDCNEPCAGLPVCDGCSAFSTCAAPICVASGRQDPPLPEVILRGADSYYITGDDDSVTLRSGSDSITVPVRGVMRRYEAPCPTCRESVSLMLQVDPFDFLGRTVSRLSISTGGYDDFDLLSGAGNIVVAPAQTVDVIVEGLVNGAPLFINSTNDLPVTGISSGPLLALSLSLPLGDADSLLVELNSTTPNRAPTAIASSLELECDVPGGATTLLDGSASHDPDSNIVDYRWQRIDATGPVDLGHQASLITTSPLGVTTYRLIVSDAFARRSSVDVQVLVRDTTAPQILAAQIDPACLWSPNHKWAELTAANLVVHTADACSTSAASISFFSAKSIIDGIETDSPDASFVQAGSVCLLATRAGNSVGATYVVHYGVTDGNGNTTTSSVEISVPHDQGHGAKCPTAALSSECPE